MSKRRLGFSKLGRAKYISHLDLLRCFTMALRRADLPVVYSNGFSPHMRLTFSLPLPVGVTGEGERVDIEFEDGIEDEEIKTRLNEALPPDIRINSVGDPKMPASLIFAAEYKLTLLWPENVDTEKGIDKIAEFFALSEVLVTKRTKKKGEIQVNLMDFVLDAGEAVPAEDGSEVFVTLSAGGEKNLKPEIAARALGEYLTESGVQTEGIRIHRTRIFCDRDDPKVFE